MTAVPWSGPGWRDEVIVWIQDTLAAKAIRLTGPIEQFQVTPWSSVLRMPTSVGRVYFKAPAPVLLHEVKLTRVLSGWRPDCILPPLGFQLEKGWMLLPDGGTMLRQLVAAAGDSRPWTMVLPTYATLQMAMVAHRHEIQALGVPDRRLSLLPSLFERLLSDEDVLRINYPNGLTGVEAESLRGLVPALTATCQELARYGIPESLDHQDLTDGNIFVRKDHPIFFDWGDASITHPFFSLRAVVVSLERTLGIEEGSVALPPIRDAYLEPWTRRVAREDLQMAFELAQRVWMIPCALAWHRILSSLGGLEREEFADKVPSLLKEFLDAVVPPSR